ncbi:MAG: SpoIIE family protein phosphatase [Terriglobia bacterium]
MTDSRRPPEVVLEIIAPGGGRRKVCVTQSPFFIGRSAETGNHLQLPDSRISRSSAALVYADGVYRLEDRGQRHGLFVNGKRIDVYALRDADTITFGIPDSFQLIFHSGSSRQPFTEILSQLEQTSALEPGARGLRQLNLLLEATALLHSHLPLEDMLAAMVDRALGLAEADRGLLLEADPKAGLRPLLARERGARSLPAESLVPSQTAIAQAIKERRSVVEEDVARAAAALRDARSVLGQQLRSVIAIPLHSVAHLHSGGTTASSMLGELLGVLYLDSHRPTTFSSMERRLLDCLALEAAAALDNARLVRHLQEQRRLEQELEIACRIQQALLPKDFQQFPNFQVTGINHPCQAVGGDYFDLMELSPNRLAFVIADVSGKGLGAALVTALLQGTFSAITLRQEPGSVFAHVNRFICAHSELERHATLFFGVLDAAGRLEFVNAGHLPSLLVHAGRVESVFPAMYLPLGLFPQAEFKSSSSALEPGDTLVLFTDGITEAANPQEEQFGIERLQEVVARHATAPVEQLQTAILAAVAEFTSGAYQADDATLLIVRYHRAA